MSPQLSQVEIDRFAEANRRTALTFIPELPNEKTKSFVGGYPRLPAGMGWPMEGRFELMFLAQIELGDLPWRPDGWPEAGTLYFFHNPGLENAAYAKVAVSRAEDGSECPSRFVYFASPDQKLVTTKPTEPYSQETYFQYEGEGQYAYWSPIGPRLERDCLPYAAIRFASHAQYYAGAWFNERASCLEFRQAWDQYGETFEHLHNTLNAAEQDEKNSFAALGASWFQRESEEDIKRRIYGGAPHIDVDGLLQGLPETYPFKHIRQQTNREPRYTSWPETGGMVMHHATSVASSPKNGRKDDTLSQMVQRIVDEAGEWADWGHERARQVLEQGGRDAYLTWARSAFQETLAVYRAALPSIVGKGLDAGASQAMNVANSLVHLSDAREFGLRLLSPDQISAMSEQARIDYLNGVLKGQLFGWGSEIQTEIRDHAEHLCLAAIYGNRDISFEADFKIWLPHPLQANAWQSVMVVNAIS